MGIRHEVDVFDLMPWVRSHSRSEGDASAMGAAITLTDSTFDEEIKGADEPVLVDFWAEWCGPCKMVEPVLEEIASEHQGKLRLAKLNVDENLDVSRRFEVMSIPTLILFKDGEPQLRIIGAKGKGQLLQELHPFLT